MLALIQTVFMHNDLQENRIFVIVLYGYNRPGR